MDSEDEEEVVPQSVTGYYLVDENESPVPFSVLPIQFEDLDKPDTIKDQVFLHGTADNGLQKVFKQVIAWKLLLQDDRPGVMVLSKECKWIRLLKPRKSYEESIRSVLITIQMLHFLKNNPEASEKSLWDHVRKVFSTFEIRPSEDDLKYHLSLIKVFHERDERLAKSQLLQVYLEGNRRSITLSEVSKKDANMKQSFIADNDEIDECSGDDDGDESEEESDLFDSVCSICDNGGELLCCEGPCMRSFHATRGAGIESDCKSLGYTRAQVEAIQNFLCKNCLYNQHQCFACGKLGSSDKSAGAEVFPCVNATCGYYYHPKCVSGLLFPDNEEEASEYQKKIADGESFTCPVHLCVVCKQGENKEVKDLQFAVCRRCPKSYHRKCLPRKIAFDDIEEEGIIQRAWEDLLPSRILIYCLKHKIDEDLGTPMRNHLIFPEAPEKKKDMSTQKGDNKVVVKKKVQIPKSFLEDRPRPKPSQVFLRTSSAEEGHSLEKGVRSVNEQLTESRKKVKTLKVSAQSESRKTDEHAVPGASKVPSKEKQKVFLSVVSPTVAGKKVSNYSSSFPAIDAETLKRVSFLREKVSPTITLEDIVKKRKVPSTYSHSARHVDKSITRGKIEGSVEAVRAALQKLDRGATVEDAKVVCEPEIVKQISRWSNKLRVYLAPFLHGMRYTSFGRHFTKVDKLKEIADKLQWYVQTGDTIVDFCCGANDFSLVMKEKLDTAGKKCSFRNFDVIQPKNDFAFEKKDWMKVQLRDLPTGSQLIMGLNPPFGVKAALANKFIDKALTFKPKLLILIVPIETKRLDEKIPPYDLVWEDGEFLSGKSFYLPGSVDVDDKQMEQWNMKPPLLYLWSRSDWTARHQVIALKHGHTSNERNCAMEDTRMEMPVNVLMEVNVVDRDMSKNTEHGSKRRLSEEVEDRREGNKDIEHNRKRKSPEPQKARPRKRKKSKRKTDDSQAKKVDESSDMSISPPRSSEARKLVVNHRPAESFEAPSDRVINYKHGSDFRMGYASEQNNTVHKEADEIAMRYAFNGAALLNRSPTGLGGPDYGWSLEEQNPGYVREKNADAFPRNPYTSGYEGYDMQSRSYNMQGQDDLLQRNRLSLGGSDPFLARQDLYSSPSFRPPNSTIGSSAMQRYAPRLDETNFMMGRAVCPGGSFPGRSVGMFDMPGMLRDIPPDSRGYTPGPQPHYPHQGSSGWLDD